MDLRSLSGQTGMAVGLDEGWAEMEGDDEDVEVG